LAPTIWAIFYSRAGLIDLVEAAEGRRRDHCPASRHFPGVINFDDLMGAEIIRRSGPMRKAKGAENLLFAV